MNICNTQLTSLLDRYPSNVIAEWNTKTHNLLRVISNALKNVIFHQRPLFFILHNKRLQNAILSIGYAISTYIYTYYFQVFCVLQRAVIFFLIVIMYPFFVYHISRSKLRLWHEWFNWWANAYTLYDGLCMYCVSCAWVLLCKCVIIV